MTGFGERMTELRARFLDRIAADRAALEAAERASDSPEIRRIAHGLAGAAGIFGFPEISEAASAVDQAAEAERGAVLRRLLQLLEEAKP